MVEKAKGLLVAVDVLSVLGAELERHYCVVSPGERNDRLRRVLYL